MANLTTDQRPTDADPRAYSIGIRYELVEGDWMYVGSVAELPDVHVYERSSCEAYSATLTTIENLREHNRDCGIAFPEPIQYRSAT